MEDEKARDRFLSDSEIVAFWKACEQAGYPSGPLGKLLLLSGQRRNELGHMEWSELDFSKRTWTIPKERAKNKERHIVHLSDRAVEILNSLPRNGSPFVFLGRNCNKLSGWSGTKDAIDKHMGEVERWTFHDLRRTAATVMAEELKIAPHVVDAILNHTSVIKGVAAIYNRARYLKERAAALDAWASYIDALVNPQPSNVVQMAAAR